MTCRSQLKKPLEASLLKMNLSGLRKWLTSSEKTGDRELPYQWIAKPSMYLAASLSITTRPVQTGMSVLWSSKVRILTSACCEAWPSGPRSVGPRCWPTHVLMAKGVHPIELKWIIPPRKPFRGSFPVVTPQKWKPSSSYASKNLRW